MHFRDQVITTEVAGKAKLQKKKLGYCYKDVFNIHTQHTHDISTR